MSIIDRIAIAVVLDEHSEDLLSSAAKLSGKQPVALELIHVLRPPALYERVISSAQRALDFDSAAEQVRSRLQELASAEPLAQHDVRCHVEIGNPDMELASKAEELGCSLILLGPSRADGLFSVGRTAQRVIRRSQMQALVAKNPVFGKPSRIVAATDFSEASRPAVEQAAQLARMWGAELVLLHAVEPLLHLHGLSARITGETEIYVVEPEDLEPEWSTLLKEIDLSQVKHRHETVKGESATTIAEAAISLAADLLVIATHGRSGFSHALLGSVTEGVLESASCPVLVVRTAPPSA